jgi:hypothetical protein
MLIACFTLLWNLGVEIITLTRTIGHKMPFAVAVEFLDRETVYEIDLVSLKNGGVI